MKKILISIPFILFTIHYSLFTFSACAQNKSRVRDTFLLKHHSPTKATILSTILPSAGQIYNHKYWKAPIIYAGAGVLYGFVRFNSKWYKYWKGIYDTENKTRSSPTFTPANDPYPDYVNYSLSDFKTLRDYYNKDLQLTYIIAAGLYILNILDAAVDANLYDYDISDKLTLHASPIYCPSYDKNYNFAVTLSFNF